MTLTLADIDRVSDLSRLNVPAEQKQTLVQEMNKIFGWIEDLNKVDTNNIKPMTSVIEQPAPLRDDVVTNGSEKVLSNAPERVQNFFAVPTVVE